MVKKDYNTKESIENVSLDNEATLSFELGQKNQVGEKQVCEAAKRFLRMAKVAQEEGFLGWQAASDIKGFFSSSAFTSTGLKASAEDYEWIFRGCANADDSSTPALGDLFKANRKLYALVFKPDKAEERSESTEEYYDDFDFVDDDYKTSVSSDEVNELVEMMAESCVEIWALAYTSNDLNNHGLILISLLDEIPLRMRGMISLAFSNMSLCEVNNMSKDEFRNKCLPDKYFVDIISGLLLVLIRRSSEKKDAHKDDGPQNNDKDRCRTDLEESEYKSDEHTPIINLDLSPRTLSVRRKTTT